MSLTNHHLRPEAIGNSLLHCAGQRIGGRTSPITNPLSGGQAR